MAAARPRGGSLRGLVLYFLKLGAIGSGGPAALAGYMRKDLVEERKTLDVATYNLSLALAQIMPGPLAAQTAIAIGYFQGGILGPRRWGSPVTAGSTPTQRGSPASGRWRRDHGKRLQGRTHPLHRRRWRCRHQAAGGGWNRLAHPTGTGRAVPDH